jgi:RNA polymerase sigma-70 factor (ECF subfamily)
MNGGRHVLTEPGCFASIFDRHAGEILRYTHARLGPELAEDVTAETSLAAFRHRDRYDTTRPDARPWLYGSRSGRSAGTGAPRAASCGCSWPGPG